MSTLRTVPTERVPVDGAAELLTNPCWHFYFGFTVADELTVDPFVIKTVEYKKIEHGKLTYVSAELLSNGEIIYEEDDGWGAPHYTRNFNPSSKQDYATRKLLDEERSGWDVCVDLDKVKQTDVIAA